MRIPLCLAALCAAILTGCQSSNAVQVYILAGQSNMEGQGVVDHDHPRHYNGGKGNLENVMAKPENRERYAHLKDDNGSWSVRDDVFVRFRNRSGVLAGGLTIGYTGYGTPTGRHHIGPELQIGHQLGDATEQPVLLIKTAWGGKVCTRISDRPAPAVRPVSTTPKCLPKCRRRWTTSTRNFPRSPVAR